MKITMKAALLACSALIASPAAAQAVLTPPPPTTYILDDRGVDVLAGSFNLATTDLVMGPAGQGGMTYSRVFAGTGWRDNLMSAIEQGSSTTYIVSMGGYSEGFNRSGSTYTPAIPQGSRLVATSTFELTWTWADGTVVVFDKRLSTGFSPVGGNFARAVSITSPTGERTELQYEQAVIEDTAPLQRAVRLRNAQNNHGYRLILEYEQMSGPTSSEQFAAWTRITGVSGVNLAEDLCNEYGDCYPAVPRPYVTYVTGDDNSTSTTTDALGNVTRYEYFDAGRRMTGIRLPGSTTNDVNISYASNRVASVQAGAQTWSYAYSDNSGTRTTTITDPLSGVTTAQSNIAARQLTNWVDPVGNQTFYYYNSGRLSRSVMPGGQSVNYTLDGRGNITRTRLEPAAGSSLPVIDTFASFPATCANVITCNKPLTTTDERGAVTNYSWDASHGGLLSVTSPAPVSGAVRPETRLTYGPRYAWIRTGPTSFAAMSTPVTVPLTTSQCATGASCSNTADEIKTTLDYGPTGVGNNVIPVLITSGAGDGSLTASTALTYDGNGNIVAVDGPLAGTDDTSHYRFDRARRPVGAIGPDPDGAGPLKRRAARWTYTPRSQVQLAEQGTVDGLSDPDWAAFVSLRQSATGYDTQGRVISSRRTAGGGTYTLAQQSYDALGRVDCAVTRMNPATFASPPSSACTAATAGAQGADRIIRYGYDAASRLTSSTSGYGVDPIVESVTYNANSQPLTLTDGNGNLSTMVYDGFGRLDRLRYPNPTGGGSSTTDYAQITYDATGRVETSRNRAGALTYPFYDNLGRVVAIEAPTDTMDLVFTYDNLGRQLTAGGGGQTVTHVWDALSRITREIGVLGPMVYEYDAAGRQTRITWPDGNFAEYIRGVYGDVNKIRLNGETDLAQYAYTQMGQMSSIQRADGTTTSQTYDPVGRMSGLSHIMAGTVADISFGYTWNPADQIVTRSASNPLYLYDPALGTTAYQRNGLNQTTSVSGAPVTYDGNQNTTAALGATYSYDSANRLTSATIGGSPYSFTYDPKGRLFSVSGSRFQYVGDQLVGEYDASGNLTTRHIPGPGLDQTIATIANWVLTQQIADERGSVIGLSAQSGAVSANRYDEYGVASAAGRFQYTGQTFMAPGLYNYRARAYAPALGRFLQPDPFGYAAGANLYGYVGADPVNFSDPFGLQEYPLPPVDGPGVRCRSSWNCTMEGINNLLSRLSQQYDSGHTLDDVVVTGRRNTEVIRTAPFPIQGFTPQEQCLLRQIGENLLSVSESTEILGHGLAVGAVASNLLLGPGQATSAALATGALASYGISGGYGLAGAILLAAGGDPRRAMTEGSFRLFRRLAGGFSDDIIDNIAGSVLNELGDLIPEPRGCSR